MNTYLSSAAAVARPTRARLGVLGFACALAMITYLDRVCFGTVAPHIQKEFHLSDLQLGMLFTAFALAYAAFEVPTGWLGDVFGPRKTLIRIVLWWSVFTALTGTIYPTPLWPGLGFLLLLGVRFFFGIGEAGAFPNISCAFARWFPFGERGSAQGAVWMAGRLAGGLSHFAVLALVYTSIGLNGEEVTHWRYIFWIFGAIGVVWCVVFWFWFRDRPEEHSWVNAAELAWIRRGTPTAPPPLSLESVRPASPVVSTDIVAGEKVFGTQTKPSMPESKSASLERVEHSLHDVPWRRLLTSLNLWTLCAMYSAASYGWYFNITYLPKYLGEQYGVTKESVGVLEMSVLAGAPLLLGSLACLVGGLLTDWFIRMTGNRKWGRRLFGAVGHGVCALCYFLSLTASSPWVFVLFIALAAFWNDITMGAAWASCIDIGGKYAGIVSGCMNTVGNLGGALAGTITGLILVGFGRELGWTINFISFGLVYVMAMLLWLRFDATRPVTEG
jgi:ACS family glucarate transporter-like MFS transporter